MAANFVVVCNYNKFGHCRFKGNCRKEHVDTICEANDCDMKTCNKRHPKACHYFSVFGRCKFGSFCDYVHLPSMKTIVKEINCKLISLESKIQELNMDKEATNFKRSIRT